MALFEEGQYCQRLDADGIFIREQTNARHATHLPRYAASRVPLHDCIPMPPSLRGGNMRVRTLSAEARTPTRAAIHPHKTLSRHVRVAMFTRCSRCVITASRHTNARKTVMADYSRRPDFRSAHNLLQNVSRSCISLSSSAITYSSCKAVSPLCCWECTKPTPTMFAQDPRSMALAILAPSCEFDTLRSNPHGLV